MSQNVFSFPVSDMANMIIPYPTWNTKNNDGYTPLQVAARDNNVELSKFLIQHGAEVNTKSDNGLTPLLLAAYHNYVDADVAKLMLEQGAEVNTKNSDGDTPLQVAARFNSVELAKLLLEHRAEVDTKSDNGYTPLHVAARFNSVELAKVLIAHLAEVNTKDNDGYTPLHVAARENSSELAKLLLEHRSEVSTKDNDGHTPLHIAARENSVDVAKVFIAHPGYYPLHDAARDNNAELAKFLIQCGAEVNSKDIGGYTPLHVAAHDNRVQLAKLLIEHKADISTSDENIDSFLQYIQKSWSSNDLQDTFRALPIGVEYSKPDHIVHELEIKDDFDDDVKSILSNILIKAIEKLLGFENDPQMQFILYKEDLRVPLIKELLKRPAEKTLLRALYIALQVNTVCDQPKKEFSQIGFGYDHMQFQSKIKDLADDVVVGKEINVIAEQIYAQCKKDKTGFSHQVNEYCSKAWKSTQDFLKSSFQQLKECCGLTSCCQNVERSFCLLTPSEQSKVYHSCSALGMMGKVFCILGIFFYILDLYSDFVVGISDIKGVSQKLGIFEIALVSITLCHENFISANSLYTMEKEFLRIKCGTFFLSAKEWSDSNLNWSDNRFKMFFYKLSCPFKLQKSFLSKLKATLYNLLTCVQLRPVVDRLVILLHEPIRLRQYYIRQAEQNSLKQFYLILEQLPQLLVQFYTFQIVINNLSPRDIEQVQCCTPPYFKKLGGVFPKYAAAAAYAGVESSELFQIFVPCTRFAIIYIFVKSKFWQLIRTIFNVLDNRFMIIVSKTFSLK